MTYDIVVYANRLPSKTDYATTIRVSPCWVFRGKLRGIAHSLNSEWVTPEG